MSYAQEITTQRASFEYSTLMIFLFRPAFKFYGSIQQ